MDKNADRVQKMLEFVEMLKQDDVDDTLLNECDVITTLLSNYKQIDKEMVARLNDIFSGDLEKKDTYLNVINSIKEGSTVVYFKSAQLFKVYKKEELDSLLGGQLRTIYKSLSESYEIIPNNCKQKIIIMCDASLLDRINSITAYITEFMKKEGMDDFKEDHVICYKNESMLEIILNGYYVENVTERKRNY